MKLELAFINRESEISIKEIRNLLSNKIKMLSDNKFSYKNESYRYSLRKSDNDINVFLSITPLNTMETDKNANSLHSLKNDIIKGKHRDKYYIIIVYDGSSEYYCCELSKKLSSIERKLRQLIYLTVLAVYGKDWVKNTITSEMKNRVAEVSRSSNNSDYIERSLEHFTFQDYIEYLFEERVDKSLDLLFVEIQDAVENKKMEQKELLSIISQGKKRSLWEKLFNPLDIENIKNDIEKIRQLRNIVMHNKEISNSKYEEANILLSKVSNNLNKAIELAMKNKYSEEIFVSDIISSLKNTFTNFDSDRYLKATKAIEYIGLIGNRLNDIINSANILTKTDLSDRLNAISLNSSIEYITKQNEILSRIQTIVAPAIASQLTESIIKQNIMLSNLHNIAKPKFDSSAFDRINKQNEIISKLQNYTRPFYESPVLSLIERQNQILSISKSAIDPLLRANESFLIRQNFLKDYASPFTNLHQQMNMDNIGLKDFGRNKGITYEGNSKNYDSKLSPLNKENLDYLSLPKNKDKKSKGVKSGEIKEDEEE